MDVVVVVPTGAEILVIGRNGEQEFQVVFRERHHSSPGQQITLQPVLDKVLLFDEKSDQRIR